MLVGYIFASYLFQLGSVLISSQLSELSQSVRDDGQKDRWEEKLCSNHSRSEKQGKSVGGSSPPYCLGKYKKEYRSVQKYVIVDNSLLRDTKILQNYIKSLKVCKPMLNISKMYQVYGKMHAITLEYVRY